MATPLAQQPQAMPAPAAISEDTQRFITANRIHIQHGSMFLDPYLAVHPRELKPENETALKEKLKLTYSLNNPSFYESYERLPVALNLASLLPVSLESKRTELLKTIERFNNEVKTGKDSDLHASAADRAKPFTAIAREFGKSHETDAVGLETLKSGLTMYLLLREALTRKGFLGRMTDYVRHDATADQILTSLQDKIGIPSEVIIEAARTGGIGGVAQSLGLDDAYVREVSELVERASAKEFSYNMVEHWHVGRQLLAGRSASIDDKIAVGTERRLMDTMQQLKAKAKGQTDVPAAITEKEQWVADGLKLLPPIQRQLLWDLGYEIGYTDDVTADKIAFYPRIYGLHRQVKDEMSDTRGTYRIYFAGKGNTEDSRRTLVHEVTHNLWPNLFTPQAIEEIDVLANRDRMRLKSMTTVLEKQFDTFKEFVDAYHKGDHSQRAAVLEKANAFFGSTLGNVSAVIAENKDAYEVLHMVQQANDRLHVDGKFFKQSGYHGPQERFREVISRYAELRFVRLREQPALMEFMTPGLGKIYDNHYLPHLERLHTMLNEKQHSVDAAPTAVTASANDNTAAREPRPIEPAEGTKIEQPKVEARPVNGGKEAASMDDGSKTPSSILSAGPGVGAERQLAALRALDAMDIHPR